MANKIVDHGPTAYWWGIFVGGVIATVICKYYPEDAAWWKDVGLGILIYVIILLVPTIRLPSPEKTEEEKEED